MSRKIKSARPDPNAFPQDVLRAVRLRDLGYRVITRQIPGDITPKNRLLLGEPSGYPSGR